MYVAAPRVCPTVLTVCVRFMRLHCVHCVSSMCNSSSLHFPAAAQNYPTLTFRQGATSFRCTCYLLLVAINREKPSLSIVDTHDLIPFSSVVLSIAS